MADSTTTQHILELPLLAPMLAQAGLIFAVGFWLVWARVGSVLRGKIDMRDALKYGYKGWIKQAGDNFSNQFEVPMLFFVLCITESLLDISSRTFVSSSGIAWAFVISRYIHALIHLTFNHIPTRFLAFFAGVICLLIMFINLISTHSNIHQYDVFRAF